MRGLVIPIIALSLIACAPSPRKAPTDGWKLVRLYEALSAEAPSNMAVRKTIAEDGAMEMWLNQDFTLYLEYGRYTQTDSHSHDSNFAPPPRRETLVLDGRKAVIVSGHTDAPTCPIEIDLYVAGLAPRDNLFDRRLPGREPLFIQGCTEKAAVPDVERVYRSIRFGPR